MDKSKEIIQNAIKLWKERVFSNRESIDPDNEHEWYTLAYGFFLGLGLHPHVAEELSYSKEVQW